MLPRLLRLIVYGALLLLSLKVAVLVWDEMGARRAELFGQQEAAAAPFPRISVLKGAQDRWVDASLAGAVEKAIDPSAAATTAVYVKSLNTGATATVNEDRVVPSASLFKVPILVEVLRQESLASFTMDTPVLIEQKHWANGAGVLQAQIGKKFPVRQLLDLMIGISDNTAALALLDLVGTDNVNLTLQANGLEATRLRIGDATRNWGGRPGENTTTAREMGVLLEMIATGKILDEATSREAIEILSQKQQASWLPSLLPATVRVAHKSGEIPGARHDAGIIYTQRNQFVAVVLTSQVADYNEVADTISRVARAAYDYFETGQRK